jgi:hypothetical protein
MDYEQFFLKSKTMLTLILMVAVQIAPLLGLHFGQADATFISASWDQIITIILGVVAMYFRFTANTKLTLGKPDPTKLQMHWMTILAAGIIALGLGGCAPKPGDVSTNPTLDGIALALTAAGTQIDLYESLPDCSTVPSGLCSKASTLAKLRNAQTEANTVLAAAQDAAASGGDQTMQAAAALASVLSIIAVQGLAPKH